jgi:hypothetical protein
MKYYSIATMDFGTPKLGTKHSHLGKRKEKRTTGAIDVPIDVHAVLPAEHASKSSSNTNTC